MRKDIVMKKDDLTQVKHIGAARMKLLNDSGIATIQQLYETPLDKLSQIGNIGAHYAKLIKDAVTESHGGKPEKPAPKTATVKAKKIDESTQDLRKHIKILYKRLKKAKEDLKPLDKKKYLKFYIDFKKRSNRLKTRLGALEQIQGDLTKKARKIIIGKTDGLNSTLSNVGKKPKKKKYKKISQEIDSFSKLIKKKAPEASDKRN